jgi:ELWxxDGT repeat protein
LKNRLLAAAAFALALPLSAQTPYLVEDLNPGMWPFERSSTPAGFALDGNTVYFSATGEKGRELWSYDGTTTRLVKDVNPGPASSSPGSVRRVGNRLLFGADGGTGRELWQTDGTAAGTALLKDINPNGSSRVGILYMLGSRALLFADDGVHGLELWITDGTAGGTQMIADTVPGASAPTWWNTRALVGDRAYLTATSGLWVTDGTSAGTAKLADGSAVIVGTIGTTVVFRTHDAERGMELWKTDGTLAGTTFLKDIAPGAMGSYPTNSPYAAGTGGDGGVLFFANDGTSTDLWRTDGTATGTQKLVSFAAESASWRRMPEVSYAAGLWWFSTLDGSWRSDGTAAGTYKFTEFWPIQVESAFGKAYFMTTGDELFSTDGTAGGTTLVKSFDWQSGLDEVRVLTILGGKAYFTADAGETGIEPWVCVDGTAAGTHQMGNLMDDSSSEPRSSSPSKLTAVGDEILFQATDHDPPVFEIWKSDGTSDGTSKVTTGPNQTWPYAMWNGSVVFASVATGQLLAVRDGETTVLAASSPWFGLITEVQRGLLLRSDAQLWYTNATAAGTGRLTDAAGRALEVQSNLTPAGGRWYFVALNADNQPSLYTTEGTPATTVVAVRGFESLRSDGRIQGAFGALYYDCYGLCRIDPGTGHVTFIKSETWPKAWIEAGRYLYFRSSDDKWWRTDGTPAGTLALGIAGSYHTAVGDLLFFVSDPASGPELWRTDGTIEGTFMVADINPGPAASNPFELTAADGLLWFVASHPSFGYELWRSDGTERGTDMVADLEPGATGSTPSLLTAAGRRLFFTAQTTATGRELWALPLAASSLVADGVRVTEGNSGTKTARFTITRSGSTAGSATVDYTTAPVNATPGVDYTARTGTITFAAGQATQYVDIAVKGDTEAEGENESFLLLLSSPTGAALSRSAATAVIEEDDFLIPPSLDARGSATAVTLSWTAYSAPAPVVYQVYRAFGNYTFVMIGTSSTTQFSDTSVLPNHAYFYRVIARDRNGVFSPVSNIDIATTMVFTDEPLIAKVTKIKAAHINELRTAITAVHAAAGLGGHSFTTAAKGTPVLAEDIRILRTVLNGVFEAFKMPDPIYADPSLDGGTKVKAVHLQELRNMVK